MKVSKEQLANLYRMKLTDPAVKEGLREPLYSWEDYNSGSTTELVFFQDQVGGTITYGDTNMQLAGQIPQGQKFVADQLVIKIRPGSNASSYVRQDPVKSATALAAPNFANDMWALLSAGWLEFWVGQKPYLTAHLLEFPDDTGLQITGAVAVENTNTTVVNQMTIDMARLVGTPFALAPEVPLEGGKNFSVKLKWASAVTLPSGFDASIGVFLKGWRFRDS